MIDPELLLGLQNSRQNQSSIELQHQILDMQKLQVLNQIRISEGLKPLAELPQPPPPPPQTKGPPITAKDVVIAVIGAIIVVGIIVALGGVFGWR